MNSGNLILSMQMRQLEEVRAISKPAGNEISDLLGIGGSYAA
jgi:hypothetical protein